MRGLQWIARLLLVGACGVFLIGCGGNGEASIDYANADLSGACGLGQLTLSGGSGSGRATTDSSSWQVRLLKTAPAGGANSLVAISCQPSRGGEGKVEIGQWGPLQGKPYVMGKFFDFPQPGIDQVTAEGNSMLVWTERDPGNTSPIQCQANLVSAGLAISTDGPFLLNRVKGQSSCPPGDDGFDFNSQLQIVQQLNASSSGIEGQLVHWGAAQAWSAGGTAMLEPMCSNDPPYQLSNGQLIKQSGGHPPALAQTLLVQLDPQSSSSASGSEKPFFVTTPGATPQGNC